MTKHTKVKEEQPAWSCHGQDVSDLPGSLLWQVGWLHGWGESSWGCLLLTSVRSLTLSSTVACRETGERGHELVNWKMDGKLVRGLKRHLIALHIYVVGRCTTGWASLTSEVHGKRARGNKCKLQTRRFRSRVRKVFVTVRVAKELWGLQSVCGMPFFGSEQPVLVDTRVLNKWYPKVPSNLNLCHSHSNFKECWA